ncbi:S66 peptidase family protein [Xylanimonas sp. McL0601]|uniref:S66 peptidase family protein n=1 Tax=Xylanimonas sp. McL0601 TaxID=3414739 RepID=UPI003CEA0742
MALTPGMRPPRLREGDVVAVVSPSSPVDPARTDAAVTLLRSWGLEARVMPHVLAVDPALPYLAGTDAQRAADFAEAWLDPDVRAVFCTRGGYGAQRLVDLVDWSALRGADPKVFVGFSDATALHQAVASRIGLASLYGPMVAGEKFLATATAQEQLRATLFEPETVQVLRRPSAHAVGAPSGSVSGVTTGGFLALLGTSLGTPSTLPGARGGLVLLEDVDRPAPVVDALLTQLRRSGWLDGAAGVVLGSWAGCGPVAEIEDVVASVLGPLGLPMIGELGFGHGDDPLTVPLGVEAELDAGSASLTLAEPALGRR